MTLEFWELSVGEELMRSLLDKFERQNPGIKVRFQQLSWDYGLDKIITAIAAGNAPDVCELGTDWVPQFSASGVLLDVTDRVAPFKDNFFLWDPVTYRDRIYGVPWLAGTRILFYNRSLFAQAGLNPDKAPATWEELRQAAKAVDALGPEIYGIGIHVAEAYAPWQEFLPFVWGNGGEVLDPQWQRSLLDQPKAVEAMEFYRSLKPNALVERQPQVNQLFAEGKVGIQISGSWNFALIPRMNPTLNFGVGLLPKPSTFHGSPASFAGGEMLVILKKSRHPEEALKLIGFLVEEEQAMAIVEAQRNVTPTVKSAIHHPYYRVHPEQKVFFEQVRFAVAPPAHPDWVKMQERITRAIEEVILNDRDPAQALGETTAEINRILLAPEVRGRVTDRVVFAGFLGILLAAGTTAGLLRRRRILKRLAKAGIRGKGPEAGLAAGVPEPGGWAAGPASTAGAASAAGAPAAGPAGAAEVTGMAEALPTLYALGISLIFISPWLLTFLTFNLIPLVHSLVLSFSRYNLLSSEIAFVGLRNFWEVLKEPDFLRALWHTVFFAVGTIPPTMILALFCAVLINTKVPFKQVYQAGLFLPVATSVIVIATIFTYLYSQDGMVNRALQWLQLPTPSPSWLLNTKWALPSIMIMNVWASFGYYMVLFLAGLQTIPAELYEAASMDGANEWAKFRHITLPQLKPILLLATVINTIHAFQVFPEIFAMTQGGPLGSTTTVVWHLYETGFHRFEMGRAAAVGYILFLITMGFSWFQIRLFKMEEQ